MKSKKIIDELLEALMETESDRPCEEFFDIWEEQEKCANKCKSDHPTKKCWLRWAKMKIKNGRGKKELNENFENSRSAD